MTVTVNLSADSDASLKLTGSDGNGRVYLTFTASDYSDNQSVTLSVSADTDTADGRGEIMHAASGGGYDMISAKLSVLAVDSSPGISFGPNPLLVSEGNTAAFWVKLRTAPTADVTVTLKGVSGDGDLTIQSPALTFTDTNLQILTVSAAEDADAVQGTARFTFESSSQSDTNYASGITATLVVNEGENETAGLVLSADSGSLVERTTAAYTVKLASEPTADVTVSLASGDATRLFVTPAVTFTTVNYATAQTVTLSARPDADGDHDRIVITHRASGGDYEDLTRSVTWTVTDNDADKKGFVFTPTELAIPEGGTASYGVRLGTQPTGIVTLTVVADGDSDIVIEDADDSTAGNQSIVTFTTETWNTARSVRVSARQDADGASGKSSLRHSATGGGYGTVTGILSATEGDDEIQALVVSSASLAVRERSSATFTMNLASKPSGDVTVGFSQTGDVDVTVDDTDPSTIGKQDKVIFTTANFAVPQTIAISAAEDEDSVNGTAYLTFTASGGEYGDPSVTITATETDDDSNALVFAPAALSVSEDSQATYAVSLSAMPSAAVTVALSVSMDAKASVDPASLTFAADDYATAQSVTISVKEDTDGIHDIIAIAHAASEGGYDGVTGRVEVTQIDNDPGFLLSRPSLEVTEGDTGRISVRLNSEPSGSLTATVAISGDSDLAVEDTDGDTAGVQNTLTFGTGDFSTARIVTISADEDPDGEAGSATLTFTADWIDEDSNTVTLTATAGITEKDNDAKEILLTSLSDGNAIAVTELTATENAAEASHYMVALATRPSAAVTVDIENADSGRLTVTPASLTFSSDTYDTAQSVTMSALKDNDGDDNPVELTHKAKDGGYGAVRKTLTVTAEDIDSKALVLRSDDTTPVAFTVLDVSEGAARTPTVKLATEPSGSVTVSLGRTGDTDLAIAPDHLTFTTDNWNTGQSLTVTASGDLDGDDGRGTFSLRASGGGYADVTASFLAIEEDAQVKGFAFEPTEMQVSEAKTNPATQTYKVKLTTKPTANVTASFSRLADSDQDITSDLDPATVGIQNSLTFMTSDWSDGITVHVSAENDSDGLAGVAKFEFSASGGGYLGISGTYALTEHDGDRREFDLLPADLTVTEAETAAHTISMASKPSGPVTVSIAAAADSNLSIVDTDPQASGDQASLTFTTANYSTAQTVTISASADADGDNAVAEVTYSATGGGWDDVVGTLTVSEKDDDAKGLRFLADSGSTAITGLTVAEGTTKPYRIHLLTQPSARVTVTISRPETADGDIGIVNGGGDPSAQWTIEFLPTDYLTPKTISVAAAEDADGRSDVAKLNHSVSGGGYGGVVGTLTVSEAENDSESILVSASSLDIPEGSNVDYTVRLGAQPSRVVTVTIEPGRGADSDLEILDTDVTTEGVQTSLTFTTTDYSQAQTVTVTAKEDVDAIVGLGLFTHREPDTENSPFTSISMAVNEVENDRKFVFEGVPASIGEGVAGSYRMKLGGTPQADVTVQIGKTDTSDPSITVDTSAVLEGLQNTLTFTTENWNTLQTVSLTAAQDADAVDGVSALTHESISSGFSDVEATLSVSESDDDENAFVIAPTSLTVSEGASATYSLALAAKPAGAVTVSVARTGDQDLVADTDSATGIQDRLTFTTDNWNTGQNVTVSAIRDADTSNGSADLTHAATGGGYAAVRATIRVAEDDNGSDLIFSAAQLDVSEGGEASYTVRLNHQPTGPVSVSIGYPGTLSEQLYLCDDVNLVTGYFCVDSGSLTLSFTTTNYSVPQTVSVKAFDLPENSTQEQRRLVHDASGGGYADRTGSLTLNQLENDVAIVLSVLSINVSEGRDAHYTVRLGAKPVAAVTVTARRRIGTGHDTNFILTGANRLTFTTTNWNAVQSLTLSAEEDLDVANGTADIIHEADGVDYGEQTATLIATEIDNDSPGVALSSDTLTVSEGISAIYVIQLEARPSDVVTVTVQRSSQGTQDVDLTVVGDAPPGIRPPTHPNVFAGASSSEPFMPSHLLLSFTSANWSTAQSVTLTAAQDSDAANGTALFTHEANGGEYISVGATLTATEADDETAAIILPTLATIHEGGTAVHDITLAHRPSVDVEVTVSRSRSGTQDEDISVVVDRAPLILTFTAANWSTAQSVTLTAADDSDAAHGLAEFIYRAAGGEYEAVTGTLTVREIDPDQPKIILSPITSLGEGEVHAEVIVTEGNSATYLARLSTEPAAKVLLTVQPVSTGTPDADITVKSASDLLTFTTADWSTDQTITLLAAADDDIEPGSAVIEHVTAEADYAAQTQTITAIESDDDSGGLALQDSAGDALSGPIAVTEASSQEYRVVLTSKPAVAAEVSILLAGDDSLSVTPPVLTFATDAWNVAQTATLSAAADDDASDGSATLTHTVSANGLGLADYSATVTVTATIEDDDEVGLTLSTTLLVVPEGNTATYTVVLDSEPTADVSISIAVATTGTQDESLSVSSALTFTTDDWNTPQEVTVTAAADDGDAVNGIAAFVHTASGGDYADVAATLTATEEDDDKGPLVSADEITVPEAGTASYGVKLSHEPDQDVTVTVSKSTDGSPDGSLSIVATNAPLKLIFTSENWNDLQSVTVTAAADEDAEEGIAAFLHQTASVGFDVVATLSATEGETDSKGLTLTPSSLDVPEAGTALYTVVLDSKPTADVAVVIAKATTGTQDNNLSLSGSPLNFTTEDWNTPQTVTLSATDDGDALDGTALFVHTASGGGYDDVTASLTATEDDDDSGLKLTDPQLETGTALEVSEGDSSTYGVKLGTQPSGPVTVRMVSQGDDSIGASPVSLSFTIDNWDTAQSVTLSAAEDDDAVGGKAEIVHTASGADYTAVKLTLTVTENDNDTTGITLSVAQLTVTEAQTATYTVELNTEPSETVSLTVQRSLAGTQDSDLSVVSASSPLLLTFTKEDWSTAQTVTLTAGADDDALAGTASISHTASGGDYAGVSATLSATEDDDDTAGLTLSLASLTVSEAGTASYTVVLDSQPSDTVSVTVSRSSADNQDSDLAVVSDTASLILSFTTGNWSDAQTVILTASADSDAAAGTAAIVHLASGGDYGGQNPVSASLTATEGEDDDYLVLSTTELRISEGGSNSYTVKLYAVPVEDVTITVTRRSGDDRDLTARDTDSVTLGRQNTLIFTASNYSVPQTVTLDAAEDEDGFSGQARFEHAASSGDYGAGTAETLTAVEADNDNGMTLSAVSLKVAEGTTAKYAVKLNTAPSGSVTLSLALSGDGSLSLSPARLTFAADRYSTEQTVTVTADSDSDGEDGTAQIAHTASGGGYGGIAAALHVTEDDDDEKSLILSQESLTVSEGRNWPVHGEVGNPAHRQCDGDNR